MRKAGSYLLQSFSGIFFSIFMPIIAIGSLILFIRIAKLTEVTQMSFSEMMTVYIYFLPNLLFYTLPITFFAALAIALSKLSDDFETIVLFSFGISPTKLLKIFLPVTAAMTALLLVMSLALIPISKQQLKSFINYKSVNTVLNIEASKFGQKFGQWLVYLEKKDRQTGTLHNIVLFNPDRLDKQQLLIADKGIFFTDSGVHGINLYDGVAYNIQPEKIGQIDYKIMKIYQPDRSQVFSYKNLTEYWTAAHHDKKRRKDLFIYIAVSFFPLVTLCFALFTGIRHPRYDKNFVYPLLFAITAAYYGAVSSLAKTSPIGTLFFLLLATAAGAALFYRQVERRF